MRAYMQKEFDMSIATNVTTFIKGNFKNITTSKDSMDKDDLSGFHFTFGMPYYEDMKVVGEGKNSALIEKAKASFGENIVFSVKLADATLMGVKIAGETGENSYVNKIDGTNNMAFLPFMMLVKDGEAKILPAEYHIALGFPLMGYGDFGSIMSTPGNVVDYFSKPFN